MKNIETSPEQARQYALRLLTSRDYSRAQLDRKLTTRGFDDRTRNETLTGLERDGWLNDRRYAERFAQACLESGRYVGARLGLELRRRGFQETLVADILRGVPEGYDETHEVRQLLIRRFPEFAYTQSSDKEKRRIFNFLLRRGFRAATISDAMRSTSIN